MTHILEKFLYAYWLRPESAIWRTLDVLSMRNFTFVSPSLDLGCGDGTFSFLRAGGEYTDDFDVFLDVDHLDRFYEHVDIYDSCKNVEEDISWVKKPAYDCIDVGLDHKKNLMCKAGRLGLYRQFVQADANASLPFEDESFQTVFSNMIYWLNDAGKAFAEIFRILRKQGKCCVMLPGPAYIESSFYYTYYFSKGKPKEYQFLELIDRGRMSDGLVKQIGTYQEWKELIQHAGLEIIECVPHLSRTIIKMWDIGLRPIFPMLKKMTMQLDPGTLLDIKREWVDFFLKTGEAVIRNEQLITKEQDFCFYCFILQKQTR